VATTAAPVIARQDIQFALAAFCSLQSRQSPIMLIQYQLLLLPLPGIQFGAKRALNSNNTQLCYLCVLSFGYPTTVQIVQVQPDRIAMPIGLFGLGLYDNGF
jgi:hypothetical protein